MSSTSWMPMKMRFRVLWVLTSFMLTGFANLTATAQPLITDSDMTYKIGEYFRAYVNLPSNLVDASSIIGKKGGPQFWDFTTGPTNDIFLYEYVSPKGTVIGSYFPQATIAERKTTLSSGDQGWLLYSHVPNVGRTVYGAWQEDPLFADAAHVFGAPVVDFPAQIKFGDTWNNLITFTNYIDLLGDAFPIRTIITTSFAADAWGVADLPNLGFGDVLRVNQLDEIQLQLFSEDEEGNGAYNNLGSPVYSRFYYWIMPGRGLVAQMSSETTGNLEGNATPPPDNFARAGYFIRMFQTNRAISQGCTSPGAVNDLRITVDSRGRALLKWTETPCTTQYRVESTNQITENTTWKTLGTTTSNFLIDQENTGTQVRYYRVVSIK